MTTTGDLRIEGLVVRTGVQLPPPAGPARTEFCIIEGVKALHMSFRRYGQALTFTGAHLSRLLADVPPKYPLHELHSRKQARRLGRKRVQHWFSLRNALDDIHDAGRPLGINYFGPGWAQAEDAARSALDSSIAAFHWLDDVAYDLDGDSLIDLDTFAHETGVEGWGVVGIRPLLDRVHELAHMTGELVGGLFGCHLVHDGEGWTKRCRLSFMHIKVGYSIGATVSYACNVCGQDPSECEHDFGETYEAVATRDGGSCSICEASAACEHEVGATYAVRAGRVVANGTMHEVSLVPRPRDPLTRITSIGTSDDRIIRERYGFVPAPDSKLLCHDCMYPCTGFGSEAR